MLNLFVFAHALMYNFHYLYHVLYSKLQDNICMVKHLMLIASNFYTLQEDIWCTEYKEGVIYHIERLRYNTGFYEVFHTKNKKEQKEQHKIRKSKPRRMGRCHVLSFLHAIKFSAYKSGVSFVST